MIRYPRALERDYARRLLQRLRVARALVNDQLRLPRHDADQLTPEQAEIVRNLVGKIRQAFESVMPPASTAAAPSAQAVESWANHGAILEVGRILEIVAGDQSLVRTAAERQAAKVAWVRQNTESIRRIEDKLWTTLVQQSISDGLAQAIRERFRVAENEARLLARDQIGTLQGQLSKSAQLALGVRLYEWSSMEDSHVRPAHKKLDGTVHEWGTPVPGEGQPGEPYGCRCVAQPKAGDAKPKRAPTAAPTPPAAPPGLDLTRAKEALIFPGKRKPAWQKLLERAFGRPVTPEEILRWAGVEQADLEGARLSMEIDASGRVLLNLTGPRIKLTRAYRRTGDGTLLADHISIDVFDRGKGLGTQVFARQVDALRKAGFTKIITHAGGGPWSSLNGYYTWPRLGFDGPLPPAVRAKLPAGLSSSTRVSDLMLSPEGRDWWRFNGVPLDLTFDLRPGSTSSRVLADYLASKGRSDARAGLRTDAAEEIDLTPEDEAILDQVWARLARER